MSRQNKRKHKKQSRAAPARPDARWIPVPGSLDKVACSGCGFRIETVRAVETGWSIAEQVGLLYHFCPSCGARIVLSKQDGPGGS